LETSPATQHSSRLVSSVWRTIRTSCVTLSARTWPRSESSSWPAMRPSYQMDGAERKALPGVGPVMDRAGNEPAARARSARAAVSLIQTCKLELSAKRYSPEPPEPESPDPAGADADE